LSPVAQISHTLWEQGDRLGRASATVVASAKHIAATKILTIAIGSLSWSKSQEAAGTALVLPQSSRQKRNAPNLLILRFNERLASDSGNNTWSGI
jgi:hypothetical protein